MKFSKINTNDARRWICNKFKKIKKKWPRRFISSLIYERKIRSKINKENFLNLFRIAAEKVNFFLL